ncbi:helix-turn-helix domain-containing protein [Hymenobacter properus]|uniref:Helix-turn-helix domain-containing protein n=1 Tax=Hymenobacter properus TaxID=2791026 RepID=A0A931BD43_9BACT|nr:helix-turn-helix domain-containing protein [Hymenobacter properus]MBR7719198.1 helix-turn-helix domain-containing protein [Microvirga sp. SRT04]
MVERIRTLLETRQLTPTQFADAIGVARPIVSHILSGRNKPSLEVVQRILAAMPDLSMPWLLNGTGPMLATAVPTAPAAPVNLASAAHENATKAPLLQATPPVPLAASSEPQTGASVPRKTPPADAAKPMPRRFTASLKKAAPETGDSAVADAPADANLSTDATTVSAPVPSLTTRETIVESEPIEPTAAVAQEPVISPEPAPAASSSAAALFAGTEKPIRRIVIFYRDGSFADYQPE